MITIDDVRLKIESDGYSPTRFMKPGDDQTKNPVWFRANELAKKSFKKDALQAVGLLRTGKPGAWEHRMADRVFDLAWEYGHSAGYNEILIYLIDLAELVQ